MPRFIVWNPFRKRSQAWVFGEVIANTNSGAVRTKKSVDCPSEAVVNGNIGCFGSKRERENSQRKPWFAHAWKAIYLLAANSQCAALLFRSRNPHECAVAKKMQCLSCKAAWVATRANALRQSRAIVVPEPETPKAWITFFIFSFSASNTCCDFLYDSTAFETFQHLYSKNRRIKTVRCGGVFF